jgi:hypothetical protein
MASEISTPSGLTDSHLDFFLGSGGGSGDDASSVGYTVSSAGIPSGSALNDPFLEIFLCGDDDVCGDAVSPLRRVAGGLREEATTWSRRRRSCFEPRHTNKAFLFYGLLGTILTSPYAGGFGMDSTCTSNELLRTVLPNSMG